MTAPLIRIEALTKRFQTGGGMFVRPREMLAVREVNGPVHMLLWQEPEYPIAVMLAADDLVAKVEAFQPLPNREDAVRLLSDPDWQVRGERLLALLMMVDWPDLMDDAQFWAYKKSIPGHLGEIIAEMAARQTAYVAEQKRKREAEAARKQRWDWTSVLEQANQSDTSAEAAKQAG